MDHHPLCCWSERSQAIKSVAYRVLSANSPPYYASNFAPAFLSAEFGNIVKSLGVKYKYNVIYNGRSFKHINSTSEYHTSCQWSPEFISSFHATTGTGGYYYGRRFYWHISAITFVWC